MSRLAPSVRLALIADVAFTGADRIVALVEEALPKECHGRIMVIERDKRPSDEQRDDERLRRLLSLRALTANRGAYLIVNQRVDLAQASQADGVHLPENGLPTVTVRSLHPSLWIGRSCHDRDGLLKAQHEHVDWTFLSPIARPLSKTTALSSIGVQGFAEMSRSIEIPIYALGGITDSLVEPLLKHGAAGVAVIGHVLGAEDPNLAVRKLLGDC